MKFVYFTILMTGFWGQFAFACNCDDLAEAPREEFTPSAPSNKIVVDYQYDRLNQGTSDWRQGSIAYGHKFNFGSVITRYIRATRFDTTGEMVEVDAYPHLRDGTYAYLNYGRSNSGIFPHDRFGAEIFQSLPASLEASLGFRRLEFSSTVVLYTGLLAAYVGNYYLYVRPFYTPSNIGASNSWTLGARYYLDDQEYLAAYAGWGLSVQQDPSLNPVGLKSQKVGVEAYIAMDVDWYIDPSIGYSDEEVRSGTFRSKWSLDISVEKRF